MANLNFLRTTTIATWITWLIASPQAPAKSAPELTLSEAILIARTNAFAVSAAKAEVRKAQGAIDEAKAATMPSLALMGSFTRFDREQTAVIDESAPPIVVRPIDQKRISIALVQPIDLFGILNLAVSGAWALKHAADHRVIAAMNDAELTAKSAYFNIIKAEDLAKVAKEAVANAKQRLDVASKRVQAGVSPRFEILRAESDVAAAEQEAMRAENAISLAKSSLNVALARDSSADFTVTRPETFPTLHSTLQDLTQHARRTRPELLALEMQKSFFKRVRQARERGNLPSLTISAQHDRDPDAGGFGAQSDSTVATASLNIPLFEGGTTRARVRQARGDEEASRIAYEQAKLQVELEVRQAFLNLQTAAKLIEAARSNVATAREALRLAMLRYENNVAPQLEVSDAEVQYSRAQSSLVAAQFDYFDAWARLQRATGQEDLQ